MKTSRHFTFYVLLLTVLFLSHAAFYVWALGTDAVDDAYISFRYAQNAIHGAGLVFNPGERVEGFTNFLWTAAMIPLEGANVDVGRASMVLGALFALGVMWIVIRFAQLQKSPQIVGVLAAFLLASDGSFVLWSVSGLETVLFAFLIFGGAYLYIREQSTSRFPFSGAFFALAAMTRPEGMFVFAITVAHQVAWRILRERRLLTLQDLARVFSFGIIFAPYFAGRWFYYKSLLPNSFYAKVSASGPAAQIERGWNHLAQFVGVHLGWLITIPPIIAWATWLNNARLHKTNWKKFFWLSYLSMIVVPYVAYIVYVGGDWSVGRFFVPILPFFYVLFSTGLVDMWIWASGKFAHFSGKLVDYGGYLAVILLITLLIGISSWNGEYGIFIKGFDAGRATDARETMGKWLKSNVPAGTLIAVDAAGQVPYFSELPSIDMFGINDLHIGRLSVATLGQGTPGHEKFDLVYVISRQPEYVVIYGTLLDSVKEYERAPIAWTNDPALQKFLTLYQRRK